MPLNTDPEPGAGSIALLLLLLFLLVSPFTTWWLAAAPPWYVPFLVWGAVIGLGGWMIHRGARRGI